jgi:hypothetical protein
MARIEFRKRSDRQCDIIPGIPQAGTKDPFYFQKDCYITLEYQNTKQAKVIKKSTNVMKYLPKILKGATDIDPEKLVDQQLYDCSG